MARFSPSLVAVCAVAVFGARPALHPFTEGCPAHRYVDEFHEAGYFDEAVAPDGKTTAFLESGDGSVLSLFQHSAWLKSDSRLVRILTVGEGDPGSGPYVFFGWSADGDALFIRGAHSGLNGESAQNFSPLKVIYTLSDGRAWDIAMLPD